MYRNATKCMVYLTDGLARAMDGEYNSIEASARDLARFEGSMASLWLGRDEAVNKRVRAAPPGEIRVSKDREPGREYPVADPDKRCSHSPKGKPPLKKTISGKAKLRRARNRPPGVETGAAEKNPGGC